MALNQNDATRWTRSDSISVTSVVVLAALLRLFNLNYMEFKGDEADNLFSACQIFQNKFPLVGIPSSIGTDNPPLFTYLLALPLAVSRNPVIAAGFIAVLNCLAVGLLFVFGRRFFNRRVALVAALLFATNPWAVFYSRKIWQQDVLPLAVIGFFFCVFAAAFEKRSKALIGAFGCFAAMTQLHLSSIYYALVMVAFLIWRRPRIRWSYYAAGIGILILSYLPYVLYDFAHGSRNLKIYLQASGSPVLFQPTAIATPLILGTTGNFFHYWHFPPLDIFIGLLIVVGTLYTLFRWREAKLAACGLWLLIPMPFLLFSKVELVPHYFIAFYPIQFLLIALVVNALTTWCQAKGRKFTLIPIILMTVIMIYQLQSSIKFLTTIKEYQNIAWMDYGPPFRFRKIEIEDLMRHGVSDPTQAHSILLRSKTEPSLFKYDFSATRYIVEDFLEGR